MGVLEVFSRIAEDRIREAMERGDLDDLPGKGQPLALEDDSHIPEDLRLAYKILKNAGCVPPEVALRKEIRETSELLSSMPETAEKYRAAQRLNYLVLKLNTLRKTSPLLEEGQVYHEKITERLERK